jgi:hypothetical protein
VDSNPSLSATLISLGLWRHGSYPYQLPLSAPCDNRKNWLFMGDGDAGKRVAIIYAVIESCQRRGINP